MSAALAPLATAAAPPGFFELEAGEYARSIVAGPDGALWFALSRRGGTPQALVGRVDEEGHLAELALPAKGSGEGEVGELIAGPDGKVWFTRPDAHTVGSVGPTGAVAEYDLSASCRRRRHPVAEGECLSPGDLAAGAGAVWAAEPEIDAIARIEPSGSVAQFTLPHGDVPRGIAVGPDGGIWFSEAGAARIGRLAADGSVREFPVRPAGVRPAQIVAGSDGALWFTEGGRAGQGLIGRITTEGRVRQLRVPRYGVAGLVLGPDGSLWTAGTIRSIAPDGLLTASSCLPTGCNPPVVALGFDGAGALWVATGEQICGYCGGGTQQGLGLTTHGLIGPFDPPPAAAHIAPGAAPVGADESTAMTLVCEEPVACQGTLRLTWQPRPGRRSAGRPMVVAESAYSLAAGERERLALSIRQSALRLLGRGRDLRRVWAVAEAAGRVATMRAVTLSR